MKPAPATPRQPSTVPNSSAIAAASREIEAHFLANDLIADRFMRWPAAYRDAARVEIHARAVGAATQGRWKITWADADFDLIEKRTVSRARLKRFGAIPEDPALYREQVALVRADIEGIATQPTPAPAAPPMPRPAPPPPPPPPDEPPPMNLDEIPE